jgi:hypothetical protein
MYLLFESVYAGKALIILISRLASAQHVQLLEIAVCNVVTAPVRHSIELQAMGELHIGFMEKPL